MRAMEEFWHGVRQPGVPLEGEDISMEEAAQRLKAGGEDPLSESEIAAMVLDVTGEVVQPEREIRRMGGWRKLAAAVLVVGMVGLMSAGAYLLWSEGRYSRDTLRFDDASAILVDERDFADRRRSAAGRVFSKVLGGVHYLQSIEQVELIPARDRHLAEVAMLLASPSIMVRLHVGTVADPAVLKDSIGDMDLSLAERSKALDSYSVQIKAGLSCLVAAQTTADDRVREMVDPLIASLRDLLHD